ncbi:MAG: McrB family protein [Thermomicrobiales bacterium]
MSLSLDWLAAQTGISLAELEEITEALRGPSPQIILAGPPGTGKTWLARQLARYVTGDRRSRSKFVQFHPSYSYESFVEGLRPISRDGGVSFELVPGVVVDCVREMEKKKIAGVVGEDFVVVIDEVNRANLPRVLGELMFLFEYRDEPVRLQYSGDFALPSNLRFVATMNTADRSIRSIDAALRRRFDVFELGPDRRILDGWYRAGCVCEVGNLAEGFVELNRQLELNLDRHHTIGHTFFMRDRMDARELRRIWTRRVFPLIEEFFFDQPEQVKDFTVERFWPGVV